MYKPSDFRIGDEVTFRVGIDKSSMPMVVVGIITTLHNNECTLYLDFDGNEGDVWEVDIESILTIRRDGKD